MAQWFGLGTSMLEVSSSKPLSSESKRFAFWVKLVAPGLPSAGYLSYVVCELLHRSGGNSLRIQYNKEIDLEKDIPDIIPMFFLSETWPIIDAKRREIPIDWLR
ncbi:hypothetical protein H5410_000977 [Solanum commersonii]|uniref:Uncharacterized protein n=1 Tax=Solanum commersonii TaxID=4109 RepID=A0A9J6AXT2_SOLCO|nr:hypothetical protein H5410_000977 [Solanum commersonii]